MSVMVGCMEAWLLADGQTLKIFFNCSFKLDVSRIEDMDAKTLIQVLVNATRRTTRYAKAKHSFDLLGKVNADIVQKNAWWAARFIRILRKAMADA